VIPVLYEDDALLAVDKPAGSLVVRGREGEAEPSLVDRLSAARKERLLVVHRLDRGTSGVLLLARTAAAHKALCAAFEEGRVRKRYLALVEGTPPAEFRVDVALVPARRGKTRPAKPEEVGKPSATAFRALERLGRFTLLEAAPETGRPHQIRVHLKYQGFPLAVDPLYGKREVLRRGDVGGAPEGEVLLERTPLHAREVRLAHPLTGTELVVEAPLPADLETALRVLRGEASAG